jgi:hypothetical protein
MRAIALSLILGFTMLAADATPTDSIVKLATALSGNDYSTALSYFDSKMKDHAAIEANLGALAAQADVSCAIDIVTDDEEPGGAHKLQLDWYMTLKSQADPMLQERRREQVQVEMRLSGSRWKIVSMSPLSILDPIKIQ